MIGSNPRPDRGARRRGSAYRAWTNRLSQGMIRNVEASQALELDRTARLAAGFMVSLAWLALCLVVATAESGTIGPGDAASLAFAITAGIGFVMSVAAAGRAAQREATSASRWVLAASIIAMAAWLTA